MKQDLNNSKVYLEEKDLNELLSETKETLASNIKANNNKTFSTVDLWNIQRSKSRYASRRTLWN